MPTIPCAAPCVPGQQTYGYLLDHVPTIKYSFFECMVRGIATLVARPSARLLTSVSTPLTPRAFASAGPADEVAPPAAD